MSVKELVSVYLRDIYSDATLYLVLVIYILLTVDLSMKDIFLFLLFGLCIVIWLASRIQLGKSFSVKPRAIRLVTDGIYRYLRHPIYVFTELANICLALIINNIYVYGLIIFHISIQVVRVKREDKLLAAKFGSEYNEYRKASIL